MGIWGGQPRPCRLPDDASPLSSWAIRRRIFVPPARFSDRRFRDLSELDSQSRER
jgi:hypothetical protein